MSFTGNTMKLRRLLSPHLRTLCVTVLAFCSENRLSWFIIPLRICLLIGNAQWVQAGCLGPRAFQDFGFWKFRFFDFSEISVSDVLTFGISAFREFSFSEFWFFTKISVSEILAFGVFGFGNLTFRNFGFQRFHFPRFWLFGILAFEISVIGIIAFLDLGPFRMMAFRNFRPIRDFSFRDFNPWDFGRHRI